MVSAIGDFRDCFNTNVSQDVQSEVVKIIFQGYREADKEVKARDYQPGPAKNLYPYVRWCRIDDYCLALDKHQGVKTTSEPNTIRNCYYTLIVAGNVRMTISAVKRPTDIPREAHFRNELASCQYEFDVDEERNQFEIKDLKSLRESTVYAFVIHGPMEDNPRLPGFIRVVFPNKECTDYLGYIDLYRKFINVVEEMLHEDIELVEDRAEVKLAEHIQRKLL